MVSRDLWEPLVDLVNERGDVSFRWVKGHSGDEMNDLVDRLAVEQQLIICTDDLRIVTWARLEAMTGNAALIDVNPGRAHSGAGSVAPS